jgi:hypothetical protein
LAIDFSFVAADFEFSGLQNVGDETIELAGVQFTAGITFMFSDGDASQLAPGETVLVVADLFAFDARYDAAALNVAGEFTLDLSDNGEQIVLEDASGSTILDFSYDDEGGWPTQPDGIGYTLEVDDVEGEYGDPNNWVATTVLGGTPGTGTDQAVSNDVLTAELVTPPSDAADDGFEFNEDGSFTYKPKANFYGTDTFTYRASDGDAESDPVTVTITVHAVNDAPVAENDQYWMDVGTDTVLEVPAGQGALANDTDDDGPPRTPLDSLAITEINYNPADPTAEELLLDPDLDNDDFEFIELQNVSDQRIDLSGVYFAEGVSFTFADGTELAPGETVLVAADAAAFEIRYGEELELAGEFGSGALRNDGEKIVLKDADDDTIQEFTYDDANGWPEAADGDGKTLEVKDVEGNYNDPGNWDPSDEWGGTPGTGTDQTVAAVDYLMAYVVDWPDEETKGLLEFAEDGSFQFTPVEGFLGDVTFTYKASDGADDSEEATVTIHVEAD